MLPKRVQKVLRKVFEDAAKDEGGATLETLVKSVAAFRDLKSMPCLLIGDWATNLQLYLSAVSSTKPSELKLSFEDLLSLFTERCMDEKEVGNGVLLHLSRPQAGQIHRIFEYLGKNEDGEVLFIFIHQP